MRLIMWTTFGLLSTLNLNGQDITGDWQGKLKVGATEFRMVVSFAKDDRAAGGWRATQLRPDLGSDSASTDLVSLTNSNLTVKFDEFDSRYEGKLSADGNQLTGRWTDGQSRPLNLRRAAPDTSWRQDRTAHRVQFVTVADNINLEVLDWGGIRRDLILLAGQGNRCSWIRPTRAETRREVSRLWHHAPRLRCVQQTASEQRKLRGQSTRRRRPSGDGRA